MPKSRRLPRLALHLLFGLAACASMSRGEPPSSPASASTGEATADGGATTGTGATESSGNGAQGSSAGSSAGASGRAAAGSTSPTLSPSPSASSDPGAEADFVAARGRFDRGEREGARAALEAFIAHHPQHPSRPAAEILLGRVALAEGDGATAKKWLEPAATNPNDSGTGATARYYLGLSELKLGRSARARELLLPFLQSGGGAAGAGDDRAVELRGALAEATAGAGDPVAALELWEEYFRVAREPERAWARSRTTQIGGQLSPEIAWRAYSAAPAGGLTRAVLGAKAAGHLRARGDASGAGTIDMETGTARRSLGFDVSTARVGPGDPTRIGLALPLSGKFQVVGEAALRAAMLAGGVPAGRAGGSPSSQLIVRDTATDPARAAQGITELTRTEAVIGIVGTATTKTGASAIAQASQDGIALMTLDDMPPGALTTAFQMVHAPELRVAALARQAKKLGAKRFAMLGPDSAIGKRLRDAFRKEVTAAGGTIVAESTYVAGATSFAPAVAAIKKTTFDAVFVPDSAERLELIAPALAVADLWPQPWTEGRPPRAPATSAGPGAKRRAIMLLSTANELSPRLLQNAGRYIQGALLCPGFFASTSERARDFVAAYRAAYGQDPHATEAYAHDAVSVLRATTERGARTRGDVVKALGGAGNNAVLQGLTGNVTFGPDHGRVDSPIVYVVEGDEIREAR